MSETNDIVQKTVFAGFLSGRERYFRQSESQETTPEKLTNHCNQKRSKRVA